ncbi:MAG TPA: 4-demethylwyosine synthase TYW1, partial [Thermoplasmatales archaeon]|nr:4-demethylwyosine synthase TYW1 [Thermoplasmatales archaeon]HEX17461.1 4-demethylwyosine synthase TYW1 [Thermoplasmatales archaeon]
MDERIASILKKQGYAIVGKHSGVKLCHWLRQSLLHNRVCYKQRFYGIESHRCLQMTPAINHCTQSCLFCWRYQGFTQLKIDDPDDPDFILEESIKAQRRLITGYKGDPRVDKKKWEEATDPKHLACSLTGEPTLYPMLGELFESAHKKGMTTFLVTNGTNPDVLENLDPLPTQLYVSITAPNEDVYRKLNRPLISKGWERIQRTLEILPSLDTRIVIRHTLVKGWNMEEG